MAIPQEKILQLKQIIHDRLSQVDIQGKIQEALSESTQNIDPNASEDIQSDMVLNILQRKGVVDNILHDLQLHQDVQQPPRIASGSLVKDQPRTLPTTGTNFQHRSEMDPGKRYLYLQILHGRAFLEHINEEQTLPGIQKSTFNIHVYFRGQRFKSRQFLCECDPEIQEGFLLELHKDHSQGDTAHMVDTNAMLSFSDPVHIVLVRTDASSESSLISSHFLEWRTVLGEESLCLSHTAELMGIGSESKVPVGILEIRMEILPKLNAAVPKDVMQAQFNLEKRRQAERERLFLVYAKQWWKEYIQIRSSHKDRTVKIFAQDENGYNKAVCAYVKPLRAGRLIDSPRHAARFVSVMGFDHNTTVGGGKRAEQWSTMHTFLACSRGDCEDHAVLLCSLLLGFGLDAYICVGTKSKGAAHAWVMTINTEGLITFWESLTGHRYVHQAVNPEDGFEVARTKPKYPYKTVGCVFNHQSFYANTQVTDVVSMCEFDLPNSAHWKAMSEDAISSLCGAHGPKLPPLCAPSLDFHLASNDLEEELRALIVQRRRDQGLSTHWDDHLSYLLTPALSSYETERITGLSSGNEEFQQAVRRAVPVGHTFKGYPIQFVHRNARKAFAASLKSPVCEEIINCGGDCVRLAVRVRVFTYPESACATWIMYACKYKAIP